MEKKKIVILGAGISGLTLAYYLSKRSDQYDITILEKNTRCGGWADTNTLNGYFFENGPRTFLASKSPALLSLVNDIGLDQDVIESQAKGRGRWLWIDGQLQKAPIWSWPLIKALLTEWTVPASLDSDETVWEFACRRFNSTAANMYLIRCASAFMPEISVNCLSVPVFRLLNYGKSSLDQ